MPRPDDGELFRWDLFDRAYPMLHKHHPFRTVADPDPILDQDNSSSLVCTCRF